MGLFSRKDGAKTMAFSAGSSTILSFVHAAKRRQRAITIGVVIAAVVIAVGGFALSRYMKAQAAARVIDGWSSLSTCLLGTASLPSGVRPSTRLRAIQLSVLAQADARRTPDKGEPWPDRCSKHAHALYEALQASTLGGERGAALIGATDKLAAALDKKQSYWQDLSEPIDAVYEQAGKTGLRVVSKPEVAVPPKPVVALNVDQLSSAGGGVATKPVDLGAVHYQPHAAEVERFIVEDSSVARAPFSCEIAAGAGRCAPLHAAIVQAARAGYELRGTTAPGAAPLVSTGKAGMSGIFRSDSGERIDEVTSLGDNAGAAATVLALDRKTKRLTLIRASKRHTTRRPISPAPLSIDEPARDATLLWEHLVLIGTKGEQRYLAAAPLEPAPRLLGKLETIGVLPKQQAAKRAAASGSSRIDGCRAGRTVVARARLAASSAVSFWLGDRWTEPVTAPSMSGVLSCHQSEAAITEVRRAGDNPLSTTVAHHHCTPAGCQSKLIKMSELMAGQVGLAPSSLVSAIDLDGKLLVVWAAGQRGGVRMRLAPAAQIAKAADVVIYDDRIRDHLVT